MKLATPKMLSAITGSDVPSEQASILRQDLGLSPVFRGGKVRIYEEAILAGQTNATNRPKPELNI